MAGLPRAYTARAMLAQSSDDRRDEDLMLAYAHGDAAAFDALYARHRGGVYRYLLRHCGNAGVADELFQDVWMNVIRARATYTPSAKFATWLYTLLEVVTAAQRLRHGRRVLRAPGESPRRP